MILFLVLLLVPSLLGLDLNCRQYLSGRYTEVRCECRSNRDETDREERLSSLINPTVRNIYNPGGQNQKVSHVILANCTTVTIVLDIASLDINTVELTDLSFEDIGRTKVRFDGVPGDSLQMVFSDVGVTELTGTLKGTRASLKMFFRKRDSGESSVIFNRLTLAPSTIIIGSAEPQDETFTTHPAFIVGMVLLISIIITVVSVFLYTQKCKRTQSLTVHQPSDNLVLPSSEQSIPKLPAPLRPHIN